MALLARTGFACAFLIAGSSLCAPCAAGALSPRSLAEDTKLYFTAPLRWDEHDWLHFGETLAVIGIANEYDDNVRTHFSGTNPPLDGKDPHSARDALPAIAIVAGTWTYAFLLQDKDGYEEGGEMLEALGLSAVSTTLFKYTAGRKRPNETTQVDDWRQSGDSFPSFHSSAAFAIGTVFAESGSDRYRWVRRVLGYGMASATAYARLHDNVHWLSDTVAGAAVGIATAHFVMRRGEARERLSSFSLLPTDGGVMLTYTRVLQ